MQDLSGSGQDWQGDDLAHGGRTYWQYRPTKYATTERSSGTVAKPHPQRGNPRTPNYEGGVITLKKIQLKDIAFARSGDKGDISNIGVIAKSEEGWQIIKNYLTPERVKKHFKGVVKGSVERYDLPNLRALNFVLHNALGGGATRSLSLDFTGKSMCQAMLLMELEVE